MKTTKVSICLDLEEAKVEASHSLIERARDVMPGADRHSLSIEVRDGLRRLVLTITLILEIRIADASGEAAAAACRSPA